MFKGQLGNGHLDDLGVVGSGNDMNDCLLLHYHSISRRLSQTSFDVECGSRGNEQC